MPEPRLSVREIFDEAWELPPGERQAYLDKACGGDAALRVKIEELLRSDASAGDFLADPTRRGTIAVTPVAERDPDRIGRYKILERIGEGGCGVVYVAEQTEPVRRRVALKVIKLGMDTKAVVARFEAERQALAMMDHPNIAKVLDGGATENGGPYFVMELVRGIKITDYCDQANLPTKERLGLFIQVCQAIQHAHQKGIIHRDIKPSNILVTLNDGVPVPKVIDFGIAKATEGRLTDATVYTQLSQFIGTPAYMSPEQAEMSSLDIDTRSDIYSLGVLLYELLAGATPFDGQELMALGLDAMRKTIREKEPVKPSTRLATLEGKELTTAAKRRAVEAPRLIHLLKGDLDWIVMKCLEKDRTRRYDTANGLATDLKRHLSNEPVVARPPTVTYRMQKLMRRNKAAFAVGAAIVALLLLGVAASLWQAARANREARRALRAEAVAQERLAEVAKERDAEDLARQNAEAVAKFMTGVFASPDPARDGRTITVAETLDRAATNLDQEFASQPSVQAQLQKTLADTYASLGLYGKAIPLQEKFLDYETKTFGLENDETEGAISRLAESYERVGRNDESLKMREEALAIKRGLKGPDDPQVLIPMGNVALSYADVGRNDEAIKLLEQVLPRARKAFGVEAPFILATMNNLANDYESAGRDDEALKLREETLALYRKVLGPEHPGTLAAMGNLANSYAHAGREDEALKLREETVALYRKVLGPQHPDTLAEMGNLANSYTVAGRTNEVLKLREEALAQKLKANDPDPFPAMENLASTYANANRTNEALKLREDALALSRKVNGPENPKTLDAMSELAVTYDTLGRRDEAIKLQERALALNCKVNGPENPAALTAMNNLAVYYFNAGRTNEALKLREDLVTLHRKVNGPENPDTLTAINNLALYYFQAGRTNEALKLREDLLTLDRKALGPEHPDTLRTVGYLVDAYRSAGRWDKVLKLNEEVLAQQRKALGPDNPETFKTMTSLVMDYYEYGQPADANPLCREALEAMSRAKPLPTLVFDLAKFGDNLRQKSHLTQAEAAYRVGLNLCRQLPKTNVEFHQWLASGLGLSLRDQGRFTESEPFYREAVTNSAKLWPKDFHKWEWQFNDLVDALQRQGKTNEIALLEREQASVLPKPGASDRTSSGESLTAWLDTFRQSFDADPAVTEKSMHLAILYLWLGQTNERQALCRKLLQLAGPSQEAGVHDQAAKAYLILPYPDPDLFKLAVASARQGLALVTTNNPYRPWFMITAGLADLRDAKPAAAEELLTKALKDANNPDQPGLALAYRAIARAQLGRTNEAQADFAALEKLAPPPPPHDSYSPDLDKVNPLALCVAYAEAKALLNPASATQK
jgi:eukaryotic-like serine/threonine-protein kinase